ncbi:hypothetical protein [Nonomuraea bangladeshensis]|uniref:hypothetical protein n=1 Tax=Nonomuraea bangladeshensis TaxID=404385 RepID=UPI003C2EF8DD
MRREVHSNYRLIVALDVRNVVVNDENATRYLLDEMATQVRRHIDHVGTVKQEWDTRVECSHCGHEWEVLTEADLAKHPGEYEGSVVGEPLCCEKAAAEWLAERGQQGGAA